jgi:hypothetical protein
MQGLAGTQVTVANKGARVTQLGERVEGEKPLDAAADYDHIQLDVRPVRIRHPADFPSASWANAKYHAQPIGSIMSMPFEMSLKSRLQACDRPTATDAQSSVRMFADVIVASTLPPT